MFEETKSLATHGYARILKNGAKRTVTIGRDREVRKIAARESDIRSMATQVIDGALGGSPLSAFAFDGSAYIAHDTPRHVVRHEVVHDKMHPDGSTWLSDQASHTDPGTLIGLTRAWRNTSTLSSSRSRA